MEFKRATNRGLLFCLLFFVFTCQVWAEDNLGETSEFGDMLDMSIEDLMDMEVKLATGVSKPINLAPAIASVVTAEQIKKIGATTLDEVLETVPGLHVSPSGEAYLLSIWSVRGIHTTINPHILLLINGTPYTSNYDGGRGTMYQMPASMISRVEVIRGPGSALYGADAYSGVVNVITKNSAEMNGTEVGSRIGSFDSYGFWAQHGGNYKGWDIAFGLESWQTGGDNNRVLEQDALYFQPGGTAFSNAPGAMDTAREVLDLNLGVKKENWTMNLYSTIQEYNLGPGAGQAITYDNDYDSKNLLADLTYTQKSILLDWDFVAKAFYSYMETDVYVQIFPASYLNMIGNPLGVGQDGGLELTTLYHGLKDHQLRFGVGAKNYEYQPDQYKNFGPAASADPFGALVHVTDDAQIYMDEINRFLWYGLVQDEWSIHKDWTVTAGVRHDKYSDFGSTTNPRLAVVWETRYDLTTKLLYGQAFRVPSFSEQAVKNNPVVIGSRELTPEKMKTYELAFDYQPTAHLRTALNIFSYRADDLIELVGTGPGVYTNFGEQKGSGFELEMDWHAAENLLVRSNFAYQRSKKKNTDTVVSEAPAMQFYLSPTWYFMPDWSLNGQYYWVGERHRESGDPRPEIKDNDIVNLTIRRKNIANNWEAAVSIKNLFDEDVREPHPYASAVPAGSYIPNDLPMESRAIWGELRYTF